VADALPWSDNESCASWHARRTTQLQTAGGWFADRAKLRAEVDSAMFHIYGIARDDVEYIMETFPIVKRKDMAAHGEYRTKRMILEIYDAMAEAIRTRVPYESK
jgi:hypothetical protein